MGFTMGNKVLPDLIDDIANGLITSPDGVNYFWSDADTTWNTSTRTGDNARRTLKYQNTITGELIYVALESINAYKQPYSSWDGNYSRKGLRVTFSSGWDSTAHAPIGTKQQSFVMFEGRYYATAPLGHVKADLATFLINYYLWIESNGFALMGRPTPLADDDQQASFIVVVERSPIKQYVDTYTNFYCYNRINNWEFNAPRNNPAFDGLRLESMMRPFAYVSCARKDYNQDPNTVYADTYQYLQRIWDTTYLGHSYDPRGIQFPLLAYKGRTNFKVYYAKPVIHNSMVWQGNKHSMEFDPIFSSDLFFAFREDGGITDGDVVAVEGRATKYLCKQLDSPDYTTRLDYAIKYVA